MCILCVFSIDHENRFLAQLHCVKAGDSSICLANRVARTLVLCVFLLRLMEMLDRLRAVVNAQLLIQVGDVPLQRPLGDEEPLRQFLIG